MADELTEVTFGTYYVRDDDAAVELERILPESWAVLHRLGFIGAETQLFRSVTAPLRYIELTRWVPGVMDPAHEHPDLIPIWTRLAALVEPHTPAVADRGLVFDEFIPVVLRGDT